MCKDTILIVSSYRRILPDHTSNSGIDFRMLSQEMEAGKELSIEESEYLMALFGTFPLDSEI